MQTIRTCFICLLNIKRLLGEKNRANGEKTDGIDDIDVFGTKIMCIENDVQEEIQNHVKTNKRELFQTVNKYDMCLPFEIISLHKMKIIDGKISRIKCVWMSLKFCR